MHKEISVHKISVGGIIEQYYHLYGEVFGYGEHINQVPSFVYLCFTGSKYIGFLACYLHNLDCIYITYAGFVEEQRGFPAPKLFKDIVDVIQREYNGIMIRIENTNTKAIKVAMNADFLITGIRYDDKVFVELIRKVKKCQVNEI